MGAICNFLPRHDMYPYREGEREAYNVFFVWECLRGLIKGFPAYIIPDETVLDAKKLVTFLQTNQITRLMTTPNLLGSVLHHPGLDIASKLGHMSTWFLEGEAVPARLIDDWVAVLPHVRLVNVYSSWESLDATYKTLSEPVKTRFAPVGVPIANVSVLVLDSKGEAVPRGMRGEIHIASPGLAIQYLNDPEKTAERFVHRTIDGEDVRLYRTGDAGRILPNGDLECMGRIDSTVKVRGFKVSIPFIESTMIEHSRIAQVAVMPLIDPATNSAEDLAAYIVGPDGKHAEEELELVKEDLKRKLPEFAFPRYWVSLASMPTKGGESRKLDRQALPPIVKRESKAAPKRDGNPTSRLEEVIMACWIKMLETDNVGKNENFFEVGGHSLLAGKLIGELTSVYGLNVSVLDLYEYPTIASLAKFLQPSSGEAEVAPTTRKRETKVYSGDMAVVGMAGRFPGADSIDELWEILKAGKDSLRQFTKDELAKIVPPEALDHPDYVRAGQVCNDVDKFDNAFWGIGRTEATVMDPQHRVFMEVAWAAVENAGYAPRTGTSSSGGVFAASGIDGYLIHHLEGGALKTPLEPALLFLTEVGSEKDYIATRVSFALDMGGPSMNVNSACSSGLVAIGQASQSIIAGACDMAIAGASSITFPNGGYHYEEGVVHSRDGTVKPFDKEATGTIFGDSVGAVVLKRLEHAVEDKDHIMAVLNGCAVTNDGGNKAGYSAPAAAGQRNAIVAAHKLARVSAEDISYVECHATATNIGDAIEIRGLTDAFRRTTDQKGYCAIGSIKGNIGHANCAAGITGFIKSVLCLYHRQLVPTAHFSALNPKIPLRGSPFYVNEGCNDWIPDEKNIKAPLRCGVSSFGIGGTNAHAVLSEWSAENRAKQRENHGRQGRPWHLLTVSAKSEASLKAYVGKLAAFLPETKVSMADISYTLNVGR
eukprot:SAG31_NODE_1358_length_8643_cov_11.893375_5_plen_937_part_00